jgi:hypothetical protein
MYERAIPADPQRTWEQSYPGTADQVRHVRAAVRQFLGGCPVTDDAVHLLSELSANAIIHSDSGKTGGTFTVRAQHFPDSYVQGEVEDQGSGWNGDLPTSSTHPHGLYLLLLLASAYGVERISRGHVVWFRLDYPREDHSWRNHPAAGTVNAAAMQTLLSARDPDRGQHDMTTGHDQPAPRDQAGQQLTAVAAGITGQRISVRLSSIGDMPVLTVEEPTGGPNPTTISIDPDLSQADLPIECTCIWTPTPGATPEAVARTIIAVLDAVRPLAAAHHPAKEAPSP